MMKRREVESLLGHLNERFGFPENIFQDYAFFLSKDRIFIVSKDLPVLENIKIVTQGFLFARADKTTKPSTNMIQLFGKYATKNIVELEKDEVQILISGEDIEKQTSCEDGYVILKYKNYNLGCGLLKDGKLKGLIPKGKRMAIDLL